MHSEVTAVNSWQRVNVAPFAESDIHSLGHPNNWPEFVRILGAVSGPSFGVTDSWTKGIIDDARSRFDSCRGGGFDRNLLHTLVANPKDGMGAMVELLLSLGVDPDVEEANGLRPSHVCAQWGDLRATTAILYCRPDLHALNPEDETPRGVAMQDKKYPGDDEFPERVAGRKDVVDFIENEKLEQGAKSLSNLAVRKEWFAVKNLVRREVIAASEYERPAFGETAAEWADHFGEKVMAQELRYYAALPSAKLLDEEVKVKHLEDKIKLLETELAGQHETIEHLRNEGDKVKFLEDRCTHYEEEIERLSEAVSSFTASAAEPSSDGGPGSKRLKLEDDDVSVVISPKNQPTGDAERESMVGNGHESSTLGAE